MAINDQDSNRGSVLSLNSNRSRSKLKLKNLSETAKSILRQKRKEAEERSNMNDYSSMDMVQDISGLMKQVNKEIKLDNQKAKDFTTENPMILEDIDDYPSTQPKVDDDLNLIIKTYERKNSLGKMKVDDSSEKKLERQNSRKKNLLENSA